MADVFISYKREQRTEVARLAAALREIGLSVWFDASLSSGESFHTMIAREVRAAKAVIVCWTPEARDSPWVIGEAQIGLSRGVLAPVFLLPTDLDPPFNTVHTITLQDWNGRHDEPVWLALLDRLAPLVGRPGIRHVALALAAGEPIKLMGINEADAGMVAIERAVVAATIELPVNQEESIEPQAAQQVLSFARQIGLWIRKAIGFVQRVAAYLVYAPFILLRRGRWGLALLWVLAAAVAGFVAFVGASNTSYYSSFQVAGIAGINAYGIPNLAAAAIYAVVATLTATTKGLQNLFGTQSRALGDLRAAATRSVPNVITEFFKGLLSRSA